MKNIWKILRRSDVTILVQTYGMDKDCNFFKLPTLLNKILFLSERKLKISVQFQIQEYVSSNRWEINTTQNDDDDNNDNDHQTVAMQQLSTLIGVSLYSYMYNGCRLQRT